MFCRYVGMSERERDSNGLYLEHVLRMDSVLTALQRRRQSRKVRVAPPTFYGVDTPGTFPRTPVCIFTVRRPPPRTGPGRADGRPAPLLESPRQGRG